MRQLPPLSALRAFEAAARLGSVTKAADELGRTHGAVSRQVRALQEQAGTALFEKAGTGLRLTPAGEAFRGVVAGVLDELERGYQRLRDAGGRPTVHLACGATFAMRWLVPRLSGFYRERPTVEVRLSMTSARAPRDDGADLMLSWDRLARPIRDEARAIRLGDVAFGIVCAPAYPVRAEDGRLFAETRIRHEHTPHSWPAWEAATGRALAAARDIAFPHNGLCIEAALSGLGVALVEQMLVRDDLAAGRLVAPAGFHRFENGFAALPAPDRPLSPEAAAFIEWLRRMLAEEA
ncbi:LysR substrate-binding domain-containing protein [Methylobacterium indicum]|uniref:LysR family transcriptional regulator n=1 Tax=Methylobacterium indicum TaxID=1775910 RepID=A0ABR5H4S4_9HYPH|nr:LysR substrate-binding domain-containing protein [Methylobacterium indicum]KMO14087.1 LysR family transcriptional regulator [Methylobacterium indicum]KMO18811.1 LysR family transcriptional regulator [Methylobacterium indicum]